MSIAIETCHTGLGEDACQNVANYATEGMCCEYLVKKWLVLSRSRGKESLITSRASSYPNKNLSCVLKLQAVPPKTPNRTAAAVEK